MAIRTIPSRAYVPGIQVLNVDFPENSSFISVRFGREGWPTSGNVLSVKITWPDGEQATATFGGGTSTRGSFVQFEVPTIAVNGKAERRALAAATMTIQVEIFQPVTTSITYEVI